MCPSRDDPLKEYSILFSNKLNTHEFLYCAMKKYGSVHLFWNMRRSTSIFLCFNTSISNWTRSTENNRFYGRKTDSSKSARSRHYYLAKSARSRHYHIASDLIIGLIWNARIKGMLSTGQEGDTETTKVRKT